MATESRPLLDVVVHDDETDDGRSVESLPVIPRRTKVATVGAVTLLVAALLFLLAHDAVRSESLGRQAGARWLQHKFDVSDGDQTDSEEIFRARAENQASARGKARLGDEPVLSPSAALADHLKLIEETANTDVSGRATVEVEREHDHVKVRVPTFLRNWATAPFWNSNKYVNVHESPQSGKGKVFVTGHATDVKEYARYWLASATHWGLPVRLTGKGTTWSNWEDKTMGLRTNLEHMEGDPVVVASDTGDVFFSCGQKELLRRFEQTGADMVVSGETQLYPEIMSYYFDLREDIDWMDKQNNMGDIGRVAKAKPFRGDGDPRPYRWPNAGLMMGRKSALLKYFDYLEESFIETTRLLSSDTRFRYSCKPFNHSIAKAKIERMNDGFYDDQLCLGAYAMSRIAARDKKFKVDLDGSILHSPGGMDIRMMRRDERTGRVYNVETGKAPCAWHFNNPEAKKDLKLAVKKFPNYFLSNAVGEEFLSQPVQDVL